MAGTKYPSVSIDTSKHPAIAVAEQIYMKYFHRDIDGLMIYLDPNVEWICNADPVQCPIGGKYVGHDGVRECFRKDFTEINNDMTVQNYKVSDDGSNVYVNGTGTYTIKATGQTFDGTWQHVFEFANGKIKKLDMTINVKQIN